MKINIYEIIYLYNYFVLCTEMKCLKIPIKNLSLDPDDRN